MLPICRTLPDGRVALVAYAESYEYTATRMGESYISLNMESPVYLDFALGDFVDFRDERFHLDYTPTVEKVSSSRSYGGAFSYRNVKFSGCTNDLVNARFLDVVDGDNHIHYSGLAKFSFFCATIEDFISRLQANLNRIYPEQWVVRAAPTSMYATNVSVEIDNKNIWEALEVLSTKFKTSFVVREFLENVLDSHGQKIPLLDVHGRPYVPARYKTARKKHLIIGEEADISGYQLQYGKGNGFVSLERSTESEQQIITRLRAYGSTKNLPALYYSTAYDPEFHVYGKDSAAMLGYKMAKTIDSDIDKGDIKIFLQFNALAYFSERESLPFEVVHDGVIEGVSGHFVKNIQGDRKFTRYAVKGNDSDNTLKTKEFTYDSKEDLIQGLQKEGNAYVSKDTKNAYILCLQERKGIDWNTPAPAPIVKVLPNHEHYSKVSAIVAREIKPSGEMQPYYEPVLKSYVFTQIVGRVTSTEIVVHYDINPDFPVASYPNILVLAGLNLSQKQSLLAHLKKGNTYLCFHDNRFKKVLSHLKAYWYPRYPVTPDNMAVHNLMLPSFLRYVVNINGKEIEIDPKQTDIVSYDQHGRIATFRYPKKSGLVYAADKLVLDPYIQDDEAVAKYGVREGCKYFDTEGDEDGGEIYPTIQGLKSNDAFAAGYNPKLASGDNGYLDEVLVGGVQFYDKNGRVTHMIEDAMLPLQDDGIVRNEMAGEKREAVNDTFYVYLKDMGFDLRDAVNGENTSLKMTSGACGEREFALLQQSGNPSKVSLWKRGDGTFSAKKEDGTVEVSAWRVSLKRSYDETLKMWFPNKNYPISGTPEVSHRAEDGNDTNVHHTDSFVLLGFDLPRMFIDAASVRLENAAREFLRRNMRPKYTYTPKFDPVFMARDLALRGENSLHFQLRAGMILRFQDADLRVANRPKGASVQSGMEAVTLFIDTLNIKMSENGHLEYGVTLKEETEVSTLQKIQHQITNLQSESNAAVTPPRARALSLTATQGHYLQKRVPDTALGHITFDDGMTSRELARLKKGFVIGEDVVDEDANMLNSSVYYIDEYGQAHLRTLAIDEHLEVPELRYNRTSVHIGYTLQSPAAGIVLRVEQTSKNSGKVFLKLEDGELGTVEVGDLLTGIFHVTKAQGGATDDADDGKLNLTFAGFATAYFEVTAVDAGRQWFTYVLRQGTSFHPQAHMTFASRGSRTSPERQNFVVYTRSYTRYLRGVADWEIQAQHVSMQQGELDNLHKLGFSEEIQGVGMFADNVFLTGKLKVGGSFKTADEIVEDQTLHIEYSIDGSTGWHDVATSDDRFMRQRKGSGAWSAAMPFGRDGRDGEKGAPGNGVESIVSEFAVNTSPTSAPTSGWSAVPPQWSLGKFLWTRSRITYTDGRVVTTVPQCDSSWQAVDGVHFSDENLILGGGDAYTSREYLVRSYPLTASGRQLKDGEEVTILIKGSLGNRPTARWMVYNSGGWISVYNYFNRGEDKSGLWMLTLPWRTRQEPNTPNPNTSFELYAFPSTSNEEVQVEWVKMVRGNKTTQAFTSSAEELSAKAQAAHHRANEAYEKAVADHKITEAEQRAIVGARAAALLAQVEEEARRIEVERNAAAVRLLGDSTAYNHLNHLNINFTAAKNALVGVLKNYVAIGLTNPENFTTAKFEAAVLTQRAAYEEERTAITKVLGELGNDVGGRNLFGFQKGIKMDRAGEGWTAEFAPDIQGVRLRCIKAIAPNTSAGVRLYKLGLGRAGYYTASFTLKSNRALRVNVDICDAGDTQAVAGAAGTSVKMTALAASYTDGWYNGFFDILNVAGQTINVGDTIELCNLMIERGRVASAWCKAEEDAMWELHNVDYLRKAFAQPSGLDGGIVFGALLQMRDTNGQVTGYFNGLRSQNGAQYQRPALALGVENFNAAGEREVTAFHFDGSGHIGKMNVRTDGSIFIPPSGANGAPISNALPMEFSPVPLDVPALLKSTYFETRLSWQASSAKVSGDAKGKVSQRIDLGTLNVERDYGALQGKLKVSVSATTKWLIDDLNPISPKHGGGVLDPSKEVRWDVRLMLTNDSDAFYTLFYAEGRSMAVAQEHPQTLNLPNMRTGAYKLVAYIQGEYADTLELEVVQDEKVKYVSTNDAPFNAVRSNGFVSYQNPDQHVYIQDGVLHVKGAPDMPGVLVAGSASGIDGNSSDYWGCKGNFDAQTAREAVGIYRINHYIGNLGYSVMITPIHSGRNLVATILRKERNFVQFVIREAHTAAQVDADFDFTILGRN